MSNEFVVKNGLVCKGDLSAVGNISGSNFLKNGIELVTIEDIQNFTSTQPLSAGNGLSIVDNVVSISDTANIRANAFYGDGSNLSIVGVNWDVNSVSSPDSNTYIYSVCYGNGQFVAVGFDDIYWKTMSSPDGINWTTRNYDTEFEYNLTLNSVCYGNGLFVAVGYPYEESDAYNVMTSTNGIDWTIREVESEIFMLSVCYGNGLFVAVYNTPTTTRGIKTSPDGINWTTSATFSTNEGDYFQKVTYGNGLFVATCSQGVNTIVTSPDGINWTPRVCNLPIYYICYGNGLFVAGNYTKIVTSSNGVDWIPVYDHKVGTRLYEITYSNGLYVAVGDTPNVITSTDGLSWTDRVDLGYVTSTVCYGNGLFVAMGDDKVITVEAISSNLQGQLENLSTQVTSISSNFDNYSTNVYVLAISGDLHGQIVSNNNDISVLQSQTTSISANFDNYATNAYVNNISGNLQFKIDNIPVVDLADYITTSEVEAISSNLQGHIDSILSSSSFLVDDETLIFRQLYADPDLGANNIWVGAKSWNLGVTTTADVHTYSNDNGGTVVTSNYSEGAMSYAIDFRAIGVVTNKKLYFTSESITYKGISFYDGISTIDKTINNIGTMPSGIDVGKVVYECDFVGVSGEGQLDLVLSNATSFTIRFWAGNPLDKPLGVKNVGLPNGFATLGADGKVPLEQLPAISGSSSVDLTNYITISDLHAISGAPNGVATLGTDGKVPSDQLTIDLSSEVRSVGSNLSYSPVFNSALFAEAETINAYYEQFGVSGTEGHGEYGDVTFVNNSIVLGYTDSLDFGYAVTPSYLTLSEPNIGPYDEYNPSQWYVSGIEYIGLFDGHYLYLTNSNYPGIGGSYLTSGATLTVKYLKGDPRGGLRVSGINGPNGIAQLDPTGKISNLLLDGKALSDTLDAYFYSASWRNGTVAPTSNPEIGGIGGLSDGYVSGGYSTAYVANIDKFSFSSNANASNFGNLTTNRSGPAGHSSSTHGYSSGGGEEGGFVNTIDRFAFGSATNAVDHGDCTESRYARAGSQTTIDGYSAGGSGPGNSATQVIDKFAFGSGANATYYGDLFSVSGNLAGASSSVDGYVCGGYVGGVGTLGSIIKYAFGSSSSSTLYGDLSTVKYALGCNSSATHGYATGGENNGRVSIIDRFSFGSNGNALEFGDLVEPSYAVSSQSSTTDGYVSGGYITSNTNMVSRFTFSSSFNNASDYCDLVVARAASAGQQV
jgi:hypothetical protein